MKNKLFTITLLSIAAVVELFGQSINHPWHVIDRGGGRSTSSGITLQSSIGQAAIQAASSGGFNLEGGYIPGARELPESTGSATVLDLAAENSWNLVSVPLTMDDYRKTSLFPTGISQAFAYNGSYQVRDTLKNGIGYWIKFPAQKTVEFVGTVIAQETLNVGSGWNMIGCTSNPVPVATITPIPPAAISSSYFGYSGNSGYYSEDTLKPALGYWVKITNGGNIVVGSGSLISQSATPTAAASASVIEKAKASNNLDKFSSLTIRDAKGISRTLYFTTSSTDIGLGKFELPPAPPGFDVRYVSNNILETSETGKSREIPLRISLAEYPVTASWKSRDRASLIVDGKITQMTDEGSLLIADPDAAVSIRLAAPKAVELPTEFALQQNYPNPFNPTTVIRYQLPLKAYVSLKIYDLLGRQVATLVDGLEDAGFRSVSWNANAVSSGMYFYRLNAGTFSQTRKLLLVK